MRKNKNKCAFIEFFIIFLTLANSVNYIHKQFIILYRLTQV